MLSQELKAQVLSLPADDQLMLIAVIVAFLKNRMITQSDRSDAIQRMRRLLKTDQPAPTDKEVAAMLKERRGEKHQLAKASESGKSATMQIFRRLVWRNDHFLCLPL